MKPLNLTLVLILTLFTFNCFANETKLLDAEDNFNHGQKFYKNGMFNEALNEFKQAINKSSNNSSYHHWLAKTYGELAESSGWLKAIRLAGNSRDSLQRAVELEPKNINALKDLMKYYQQAPTFLGGSDKKAKKIGLQLKVLKSIDLPNTSEVNSDAQNG